MNTKNLIFLILVTTFSNNPLNACRCGNYNGIEKEVENSDKILTGKILSKEIISRQTTGIQLAKYTLEVKNIFKGNITKKEVKIYTGLGGGDCGIRFEIGKEYLIYGNQISLSGFNNDGEKKDSIKRKIISTNTCKRTKKLDENEISEIKRILEKKK